MTGWEAHRQAGHRALRAANYASAGASYVQAAIWQLRLISANANAPAGDFNLENETLSQPLVNVCSSLTSASGCYIRIGCFAKAIGAGGEQQCNGRLQRAMGVVSTWVHAPWLMHGTEGHSMPLSIHDAACMVPCIKMLRHAGM
jgi:hypothetical protein